MRILRFKSARRGLAAAALAAAALWPGAARGAEPEAEALDALLKAVEALRAKPDGMKLAVEALRAEAAKAKQAAEAGKAKEAEARLAEKAKQAEALKAEVAELAAKKKAAEEALAKLEQEIPAAQAEAKSEAGGAEAAAKRAALLEQVAKVLGAIEPEKKGEAAAAAEAKPAEAAAQADAAASAPAPAAAAPAPAAAVPAGGAVSDEAAQFFETKVRPVLAENCYSCHGPEKQKANLRLDSLEAILKGGDGGPGLIAGDAEKSRIVIAVNYGDELQMPPKGKLPQEAIDAITQWVKMGAPWPAEKKVSDAAPEETMEQFIARARQTHWAFKPVRNPAPPAAEAAGADAAITEIDRFILADLAKAGIAPGPKADKRTLLRRATFDLTGLPPTPKELAEFEADGSPEAFAKLVERLLASPRYGERWARHWLDLARYADTKGYVFQEERRFPFSYTYRDYVIRAFNEDLPYDRFIQEQLAADKLPLGDDKRALAGMGFLTLGRRFIGNIHDITDDRIDVTMRTFMGLTVTCARCHDHKFDPIPAADYYSLYGIFRSSVEPGELPLIEQPKPSPEYEDYVKQAEAKETALAEFRAGEHRKILDHLRATPGDYLLAAREARDIADETAFQTMARDRKLHWQIIRKWQKTLEERAKAHDPIFAPWNAYAALPADEYTTRSATLAAEFAVNATPEKPLNAHVAKKFEGEAPKSLAEAAARYGALFAEVERDWSNFLQSRAQMLAQAGVTTMTLPAGLSDPTREEIRQVIYGAGMPANVVEAEIEQLFDIPTRDRQTNLRNDILAVKSSHPGRPPRAMVLEDSQQLFDPYVFKRGKPDNKGDAVPRQFPAVLAGLERKPFSEGSGRLELARAIADRANPLTARVFVNRVWAHHFGKGFVPTPSDFGVRSDRPTHPELFDYLASRFMDEGWSVKKLHRAIMLSAAYQRSSEDIEANRAIDPENKLLWRFNRQRLDFESMRDSMLAAAGKLDEKMGGPAVELLDAPFTGRRTIYGVVERQNLPGIFRTFDFANPDAHNPARFTTTVPQQALFLMNSPFVTEQARAIAARSDAEGQSDEDRVRGLYRTLYLRDATEDEIAAGVGFVRAAAGESFTPPPPPATMWQYGYGEYDEAGGAVKSFTALPHFNDGEWRGGAQLPDKDLGWVSLGARGGHTEVAGRSAIRRWVAPRRGFIEVKSRLRHESDKGDGVRGYVWSSRLGQLGKWEARNSVAEAPLERTEVYAGDTIDFIVTCGADINSDSFKWAPRITMVEEFEGAAELGDAPREWNAAADFSGPIPPAPPAMAAWEQYAQALLIANEFMFVD